MSTGPRWPATAAGAASCGTAKPGSAPARRTSRPPSASTGHQDPALHRVGFRGAEPPDLRRAHQLRHALEPHAGRAADRAYRPHRAGLPRVWIRNYFYERPWRPTIYQRLDERIGRSRAWWASCSPSLSQVARAIESAAMAPGEQRDTVIREHVDEINRMVREGESTGIGLDSIAGDHVEARADIPAPVTLTDLERTLVQSKALGSRFRPHPKIAGAHLLDWNGEEHQVTFNPILFDEHPNTLTLVSFGADLLDELLDSVEVPVTSGAGGFLRDAMSRPQCPWSPTTYPARMISRPRSSRLLRRCGSDLMKPLIRRSQPIRWIRSGHVSTKRSNATVLRMPWSQSRTTSGTSPHSRRPSDSNCFKLRTSNSLDISARLVRRT